RRPRRARGPPVGASRRHTTRPRGDARPARGAECRAVRCAGTHRGRAGVRSQRRARSRHSRALRPLRAGASARHFGAACRVPRRLAGAAVAQAAARVRSPLCRDGSAARRLSVAARVAPARRPGRRAVACRRARPLAGIVVPGLVLALALSGVIAGAAHLVAAGAGLGLALLDLAAGTAAVVPGGHVVMVAGWEAAAVWAGVALVAWWLWHSPRRRW